MPSNQIKNRFDNLFQMRISLAEDIRLKTKYYKDLELISLDINEYIQYHQTKFLDTLEVCINTILTKNFGKRLIFEVVEVRQSITVKTLLYDEETKQSIDLYSSSGGGLCDIVSFIIRAMFIANSNNEQIIFIDEPFIFVSEQYNNLCLEIIHSINTNFDIKIAMITHEDYISNIDIEEKNIVKILKEVI